MADVAARRRGNGPGAGGGAAAFAAMGRQDRRHAQHAGKGVHRLLGRLAQRLKLRPALGIDLDGKGDMAVADGQAGDHAQTDDVAAAIRVADPAQGGHHVGLGHGYGRLIGRRHA